MIPQEQLHKLKPLQDIQNRMRTIKGQVKHHSKKLHLTKKQRNFVDYPIMPGSKKHSNPHNYRDYRRLPKMELRK